MNEPIPGQGVFWSSVGGKPYPVSVRALLFEEMVCPIDLSYSKAAAPTFARTLRERFETELRGAVSVVTTHVAAVPAVVASEFELIPEPDESSTDVLGTFEGRAINALREDAGVRSRIQADGVPWGELKGYLADRLPETLDGRDNLAFQLVAKAMNEIYGKQNEAWHTEKKLGRTGKMVTVVRLGRR